MSYLLCIDIELLHTCKLDIWQGSYLSIQLFRLHGLIHIFFPMQNLGN